MVLINTTSYEDMLNFLDGEDFEQKHFALAFMDSLKKPEDIEKIIKNLIDQDTKIRELSSSKINDFVSKENSLIRFLDKHVPIILNTTNDINPQVCRNIISLLELSEQKKELAKGFMDEIENCLEETKYIKAKTHKVNKKIFNLYWNIFALEHIIEDGFEGIERLLKLIKRAGCYKDYTIRERAAFLTQKLHKNGFEVDELIKIFKNDSNFYVKNIFQK